MSDYNEKIIREFRANAGRVGGSWEGRDLLLLTTTGRKSGKQFTTPIVYTRDGDRLLVYASNGGAPEHPDWFLNLTAHPDVVVEVGGERYDATTEALEGDERDREYDAQAARVPAFDQYRKTAGRVIPVVALRRNG
jgi:deazaflavin-dependent oxidoreductase (nitroreductase family)